MLASLTLLCLAPGAAPSPVGSSPEDPLPFVSSHVDVGKKGETLALRDLEGDGTLELLRVNARGLGVRALTAEGAYAENEVLLPWSTATTGWDLADLDGDGVTELLTVTDGEHLVRRRFTGEGWDDGDVLAGMPIYLPSGLSRVPFARDVDGDERLDLVLPGPGRFHILLNRSTVVEGDTQLGWASPLLVEFDPNVDYDFGDPMRLSSTFGQSIIVPFFTVEDVDGDGRQDLVSEVDDRISVHLARPEIDSLPTWELDLSGFKDAPTLRDVDLDNLLGSVSGFAQWRIADLDGVPPNDLVMGAEGEVRVYLGGGAKGASGDPDQVLKASGNVLRFFVRDVAGDPRPDLQIVRGERVSLSRLLKYLVLPGQLDFDVLTYENQDGALARRPTQRATIGLRVPRLITFFGEAEELGDRIEAQWKIPAIRIDWDRDGSSDDVIDEVDGELWLYRNAAPPEHRLEHVTMSRGIEGLVEQVVLRDTDRLGDGGLTVIDIETLDDFVGSPGAALRAAVAGRETALKMPLRSGVEDREFRAVDLNADGKTDILTVIEGDGTYRVEFLVQR
ncbi:FG-GAP repeat protein [Planctomycetes bacterium Poly30]|uniref:FG-GAP repeat protein n=1 Tax=Saltatorellus ferox TaxID=2528018 RepID=A0A518EPT8_9BACT|nr:FG-GAP repeat protein [Planctomycetes bacterium Poly30]